MNSEMNRTDFAFKNSIQKHCYWVFIMFQELSQDRGTQFLKDMETTLKHLQSKCVWSVECEFSMWLQFILV